VVAFKSFERLIWHRKSLPYEIFVVDGPGLKVSIYTRKILMERERRKVMKRKNLTIKKGDPMKKVIRILGIGFCLALMANGAVVLKPLDGWAQAPSGIKVGTTISESGYMAEDSIPSFKGRKLAIDLVNKKGGLFLSKYNKKVPVKLISYDDKSESSTAVRDFLRLAEKDQVDFLLSAHGSELSFAVAKIAETNKIPMTIYAGYANKIWTQGYKWIFNVGPTASEYCEPFVNLVKGLPGKHKVGLIAEDGLWAKAVSESMVKVAKKEGLDFEIVDVYPADSKDVSSSVNKVIAANCDIIGTVSHVRNDLLFTRTILEMGVANKFKLVYVQTATGYPSFSQKFKANQIEGIVGTSVWASSLNTSGNKEFLAEFTKAYNEEPSWVAAIGYAGAQAMLEAIQLAGTVEKEKVRETFLAKPIKTIIGDLKFKQDGTSDGSALVCPQMQSGVPETVFPKQFVTKPLIFPQPAYK
jgi:branched-chain amino acid transport system substrate-binding protein